MVTEKEIMRTVTKLGIIRSFNFEGNATPGQAMCGVTEMVALLVERLCLTNSYEFARHHSINTQNTISINLVGLMKALNRSQPKANYTTFLFRYRMLF